MATSTSLTTHQSQLGGPWLSSTAFPMGALDWIVLGVVFGCIAIVFPACWLAYEYLWVLSSVQTRAMADQDAAARLVKSAGPEPSYACWPRRDRTRGLALAPAAAALEAALQALRPAVQATWGAF